MAAKFDQKQTVDFKELLMSDVIQSEALINILERKGVVNQAGTAGGDEKSSGEDD